MSSHAETQKKILDAFEFRHAAKSFDPTRKITEEDFRIILEAARLSPSSVGLEPWKFLVIQNPQLREQIKHAAKGAQGQLPTASHFVILLARKDGRYDSPYFWDQMTKVKEMPEETVRQLMTRYAVFQGEERKLFESDRALYDWASKQTYIALGNMLTTAAMLGIDSCPIEGFDPEQVDALLEQAKLLENGAYSASVMAAFGYRTQEPRPKTRRSVEDVIQWVD